MALTEPEESRPYTDQEINQVVEDIDKMCLFSRREGELLFRCKWIIKQLMKEKEHE